MATLTSEKTAQASAVVTEKKVVTWQEIDAKIAQLKAEAKALKALTGAKTGTSAKSPEEKLNALKAKWSAKSPKGAELLGSTVAFRPFGQADPIEGELFSMVEDKRVPTVLLKIRVGDQVYHKDHKSINLEVFKVEDGVMIEI